jgi:hypothetical protein
MSILSNMYFIKDLRALSCRVARIIVDFRFLIADLRTQKPQTLAGGTVLTHGVSMSGSVVSGFSI